MSATTATLYGDMLAGDFDLGMSLTGAYAHQHDQAGAMVRPGFPVFSDLTNTPR
jgi:regulation of enolase protein 1 (concanavalin A-like superfamily)